VKPKKRFRIPPLASWSLLGLVGLLLVAILSSFGGYNEGIRLRKQAEVAQKSAVADEQFQLGLQDMEAGRFDRARQRFEYVIELNPSYPGVTEKLADALLFLNATATPTVAPTPTVTPTPDTRNVDQLFAQSQQDLANSNWSAAIDSLLALRKADPNFQPVWVDDMLFVAFRNRGKDKVLGGDLEGGIYDLTIAEQFGYLDFDSRSLQDWARLYITGASFWELDWSQAVFYFAQVAPALPNLSDGSGWTAAERYRLALIGYGEDLIEQAEWCSAQTQLELAISMGPDEKGEQLLEQASNNCGGDSGDEDEEEDTGEEQPTEETETPPTEEPTTEPAPTDTETPPEETPSP
jgi:tetratricopeptide (TPR) repeat protein